MLNENKSENTLSLSTVKFEQQLTIVRHDWNSLETDQLSRAVKDTWIAASYHQDASMADYGIVRNSGKIETTIKAIEKISIYAGKL